MAQGRVTQAQYDNLTEIRKQNFYFVMAEIEHPWKGSYTEKELQKII